MSPRWKGAQAAFNPVGAAWLHLPGAAWSLQPFALGEAGVVPPGRHPRGCCTPWGWGWRCLSSRDWEGAGLRLRCVFQGICDIVPCHPLGKIFIQVDRETGCSHFSLDYQMKFCLIGKPHILPGLGCPVLQSLLCWLFVPSRETGRVRVRVLFSTQEKPLPSSFDS